MDRFVSHYTLRLDAKGRVSIPAPFRAVLARDGYEGIYCYPALGRPALDAGGHALLAEIETLIGKSAWPSGVGTATSPDFASAGAGLAFLAGTTGSFETPAAKGDHAPGLAFLPDLRVGPLRPIRRGEALDRAGPGQLRRRAQ